MSSCCSGCLMISSAMMMRMTMMKIGLNPKMTAQKELANEEFIEIIAKERGFYHATQKGSIGKYFWVAEKAAARNNPLESSDVNHNEYVVQHFTHGSLFQNSKKLEPKGKTKVEKSYQPEWEYSIISQIQGQEQCGEAGGVCSVLLGDQLASTAFFWAPCCCTNQTNNNYYYTI